MSIRTRIGQLEKSRIPPMSLPPLAIFFEEPTAAYPHAANGLVRADGETYGEWIDRYQRELGSLALVISISS
jgi:hypothetical protein